MSATTRARKLGVGYLVSKFRPPRTPDYVIVELRHDSRVAYSPPIVAAGYPVGTGGGGERSMASTQEIKKSFERGAKAVKLRPSLGKYSSVTRVRLRDGLTCDIEDGPWKLVADMGKGSGGEEQGPTPGVYGRAALGSCLAIATAQWAAKLGVPLDDLEVEVQSDADAAGTYGVADVPAGYTQVRCIVTVKSPAPEREVRKLLDVATERCLYWDVFARAVDLRREVRIVAPAG